ncbi:hypothetical protein Q4603_13835 [Zobellia galactanivorans]|uniref:hypothetical protein n=1 Tax=Zobellia galactanivorans (strain DSM 12802 / CCUG 47099 / CIP 106680 / NCIMB 13871 / Dsij) TaxID=63186 RepID=UPI0026E386A1|nr:hypothetical protein [Zobellia galactanivorans]MDO6809700.1 hypothetical protein [Zobellia galactanivorans]
MKYAIRILAVLAILFVGCDDNEYEAPFPFSDIGFYTSKGTLDNLQVNIDEYLSFTDLSQGAVSHKWTIEASDAFLEGPIDRQDTILEKFIIEPRTTTSYEKTVHVLFQSSGTKKVRLHNTFNEMVVFKGNRGDVDYEMPAKKEGDVYVIDTTFLVKVYPRLVPKIKVRNDDVVVNHEATDTVYIEAGSSLEFTDLTTIGEPTGRTWSVRKALKPGDEVAENPVLNSSGDSIANITFNSLGSFRVSMNSSRSGQNLPGAFASYQMTAPVKVIPSSKPFELTGAIRELEDETIQVPYNGEFTPFGGQEEFFTVMVNGEAFEVASVTVNEDDATKMDIKLAAPIYRPDVITVSYSGGTIESTDTREALPFTDEPVIMSTVNLVPEAISGLETGADSWGTFWSNKGTVEYSTEQASTGNYSLKLQIEPGQDNAEASAMFENPIIFEEGKSYIVSYDMYVKPGVVGSADAEMGLFLLQNWNFQVRTLFEHPEGVWVTITNEYVNTSSLSQFYLRILTNADKTTAATVYYDNFSIIEKEERP